MIILQFDNGGASKAVTPREAVRIDRIGRYCKSQTRRGLMRCRLFLPAPAEIFRYQEIVAAKICDGFLTT